MALPYVPNTTWVDEPTHTTPLAASRLNHIEEGIGDLSDWTTSTSWTSYTPSVTNITLGNGTITGRYSSVKKTVTVNLKFTFGSTSSLTGAPQFSLPTTIADTSYNPPIYGGLIEDSGTGYYAAAVRLESSTTFGLYVVNSSTTYALVQAASSTVPMTWATGDTVVMSFAYESA